jgi:2-amino-4-hydroxy-6-hydroxymethyldihydropteridine diphosphokinase
MPAKTSRTSRNTYLIALGSNVRHHRYGRPRDVLAAALGKLEKKGITVQRASPVIETEPVGPSMRRYANAAALVETQLDPQALLRKLKKLERKFGRRSGGQRWRSRVLDLDVVLWSGGCFAAPGLVIPHPLFRERDFVLRPAAAIAPAWRDPVSGFSLRQLLARLTRGGRLPK